MTYLQTDFKLFLENNGFKDFSLDKILEIPSINNLTSEFRTYIGAPGNEIG